VQLQFNFEKLFIVVGEDAESQREVSEAYLSVKKFLKRLHTNPPFEQKR
jgi:hypothetical protein